MRNITVEALIHKLNGFLLGQSVALKCGHADEYDMTGEVSSRYKQYLTK